MLHPRLFFLFALYATLSSFSIAMADDCSNPSPLDKNTPDYRIRITYPILSTATATCQIHQWLDGNLLIFNNELKKKNTAHHWKAEYLAQPSTLRSRKTETAILNIYEFTGGANGMTHTQTFTLDRAQGRFIGWLGLFKPGSDWYHAVYPYVLSAAQPYHTDAKWFEHGAGPNPDLYQRFALDQKDLVLYFEPVAIAPHSAGTITVRIPLVQLKPILNPLYLP